MLSKNIRSLWNRASLIGIKDNIANDDLIKIRLINQMAMVLLITVSFFLLVRIFLSIPLDGVDLGMILITFFILALHHFNQFKLARHITCWFFPFAFAVMLVMSQREFGYFSVFLLCSILAFIQYEGQNRLKISSILFIALLGITSILLLASENSVTKLPENPYEQFISFIGTLLAAFLIVYFYQNNIKESQAEKEKLILSLRSKNEELVNVNQALDQFAFIASHDLKTPLLNIMNFSGLLESNFKEGEYKDAEQQLSYIKTNAVRMNLLINDLFEFTRLDDDSKEKKENVDLNKLCQSVIEDLNQEITLKNAKINVEGLPTYYCDYNRMHLIFKNIIQNGIKYNESKIPEVKISSSQYNNVLHIHFKDNGIGINEKYHERIFEFFKRLHNYYEVEGTGMGLGLSRKIIQKMSGNIKLKSEPGKGSTFTIELPMQVIFN